MAIPGTGTRGSLSGVGARGEPRRRNPVNVPKTWRGTKVPKISVSASVSPPPASATASISAPAVTISVAPPKASGVASATAPLVKITVIAPTAGATASATVPVVHSGTVTNATVNAPTAHAFGYMPIPFVPAPRRKRAKAAAISSEYAYGQAGFSRDKTIHVATSHAGGTMTTPEVYHISGIYESEAEEEQIILLALRQFGWIS